MNKEIQKIITFINTDKLCLEYEEKSKLDPKFTAIRFQYIMKSVAKKLNEKLPMMVEMLISKYRQDIEAKKMIDHVLQTYLAFESGEISEDDAVVKGRNYVRNYDPEFFEKVEGR